MRLVAATVVTGVLLAGAAFAFVRVDAHTRSPTETALQRDADRLIAASDIPGVITLVERDGHRDVVAAGEAELGRRAADPDGRFWVGSVTKTFIAVLVLQLVADRALSLDDRVDRLLPGRLRAGDRIRLRNLLNHTSGLTDYMSVEPSVSSVAGDPEVVIPARKLVSSVADFPLEFEPGSQASYSNTNYLVLGEILERITGSQLTALLDDRIFAPLDLEATEYENGRRSVRADEMHGYDLASSPPVDVSLHALGGPWADGGIVSNARDLATFFTALLRGEIVPPALVAEMQRIVPGSHGEGLGLYRLPSPCGRWLYGHTGGTPGYVTFAAGSRDGRRFLVVHWNGVSSEAIAAMDTYLDALICRR